MRDAAKLEACVCYLYTATPLPPAALCRASAAELVAWLGVWRLCCSGERSV